jgi:hypothetical protein
MRETNLVGATMMTTHRVLSDLGGFAFVATAALTIAAGCSESSSSGQKESAGASAAGAGGREILSGGTSASAGESATLAGTTALGGRTSAGRSGNKGGNVAAGGSSAASTAVSVGGASATGSGTGPSDSTIPTHCTSALPSGTQPVDMSDATTIGTGSADSCRFGDLSAAVAKGGKIKFDCGSAPVTIAVTATMNLPTNKDTVIDGGNSITLDGGSKTQILHFDHSDFQANTTRVTLQHLALINGKSTPAEAIPAAPTPCSQGWNDGQGGALFMNDGNLTIIDCTFSNNQGAPLGPDTGGGAIYIVGSKSGALIVNSIFTGNSASNAGAIGGLFAELDIYDSRFQGNTATGNGANNDDASQCSSINNGQHEIGSGGNGGAIYQDGGNATNVVLCGVDIVGNAAGSGAFGGGVFMTSNDWSGTMTIKDCVITGNSGGSWTQVQSGSVTDVGSAFGVNAKSITVSNSTLQGVR